MILMAWVRDYGKISCCGMLRTGTLSDENQSLHAIVHGRVQGVSFRYYATAHANELGLTGWVRNLPDGTVEVMAEGSRERLDQLLQFLQTGPTGARVSTVETSWQTASGHYNDFSIH
jgi:acylphosphatase